MKARSRSAARSGVERSDTAATGWRSDAGFRPDIEGLRGLAVLLVVVFHAGLAAPGGFIGVDVFFVISGFLITGLLLREREKSGRINLLAFYARRVRRLLPAAVVVLAVTLPIAYALYAPLDRAEMLLDGAASALSVGNIRFALAEGDYFQSITAPSPFLHFWSLGVEEQFYLVWPALLLLAATGIVAARAIRVSVAAVLLIVFGASLAASIVLTDVAPNWAFYSLPTRAFELAAGGLLAVGVAALARVPSLLVVPFGWLGLVAIGWSALSFDELMAFPGTAALVPTLGTVALIAAGGRRFGPGALMSFEPLRFVGRISYSLYLWHWPILVLGGLALGFSELGLLGGVFLVSVSIAVATLSWAFVEEPFRRGLPAFVSRPGRTVFAGVSAILAVVVAANGMAIASNRALTDATTRSGPVSNVVPAPDQYLAPEEPGSAEPEEPLGGDEGEGAYELPEVVLPGEDPTPIPLLGATPSPVGAPATPTAVPGNATAKPRKPTAEPILGGVEPTPQPLPSTPKPTKQPKRTAMPTAKPTPKPDATFVAPPPKPAPMPSDYGLSPDVRPALVNARNDKERIWFERCLGNTEHTAPRAGCIYGSGSYTVALVGDSHASHWFPAMEWVALQNGWRLAVMVKVSCPFIDVPVMYILGNRTYPECSAWNEAVVGRLNDLRPNLTVVANSKYIQAVSSSDNSLGAKAAGVARMIGRVPGKVVVMTDTPRSAYDVPACLSANLHDIRACATARRRALSSHGVLERRAAEQAGVALIDLAGRICIDNPCPAVVDNMIVYRDSHHLTATFARSLGPDLKRVLKKVN